MSRSKARIQQSILPSQSATSNGYLGKRARLASAPVSLAYISLFTLALSLILLLVNLQSQVDGTKMKLDKSCSGVESVGSFATSTPHYLATVTNDAIVSTVNSTISLTITSLNLILDVAIALVRFGILLLVSPKICFFEFVIRAALQALVDAAESIQKAVEGAVDGFMSAVKGTLDVADKIAKGLSKIPGVKVPGIPDDVLDPLSNGVGDFKKHFQPKDWMLTLNNTVPTLPQAIDAIVGLFTVPAEMARRLGTQALLEEQKTLSTSMLPIPDKKTVSFCDNMNTSFVDEVGDSIRVWAQWGLVALVVVAFLLAGVLILIEWMAYSFAERLTKHVQQVWNNPTTQNPTDRLLAYVQMVDHPILSLLVTSFGGYGAAMWFATYVTYPPALLYLFVGLLGIGLIQLQLWVLDTYVRKDAESVAKGKMDEFKQEMTGSINGELKSISKEYADKVNGVITGIEDKVNTNSMTHVKDLAGAMEDTIDTFTKDVITTTEDFFSVANEWGSLVSDLVKCLIGTQVNQIEAALQWVQDNAEVEFKKMDECKFCLSDTQMSEMTGGFDDTSSSSSTGKFLDAVITSYEDTLKLVRWMFIGYASVWVVVFIMGVIGFLFNEAVLEWHVIQWNRVKAHFSGESPPDKKDKKTPKKAFSKAHAVFSSDSDNESRPLTRPTKLDKGEDSSRSDSDSSADEKPKDNSQKKKDFAKKPIKSIKRKESSSSGTGSASNTSSDHYEGPQGRANKKKPALKKSKQKPVKKESSNSEGSESDSSEEESSNDPPAKKAKALPKKAPAKRNHKEQSSSDSDDSDDDSDTSEPKKKKSYRK